MEVLTFQEYIWPGSISIIKESKNWIYLGDAYSLSHVQLLQPHGL